MTTHDLESIERAALEWRLARLDVVSNPSVAEYTTAVGLVAYSDARKRLNRLSEAEDWLMQATGHLTAKLSLTKGTAENGN